MKVQPYDPFYIAVEHVAAPFPPEEALPFLQAHADRLGIPIHWSYGFGYILAIATPGEGEPKVFHFTRPKEAAE